MVVRRIVHRLGYRYRLHSKDLPGHPDLVFPARRKVIFVHGCFWHRHSCSSGKETPNSRADFWLPKLKKNRERDIETCRRLRRLGWDVLVVWECWTKSLDYLEKIVSRFLGPPLKEMRQ